MSADAAAEAPVHALVPCRAGSQRVPQKNTRPFAGLADGLIGLKLDQLTSCRTLASIVVTTDDPAVMRIAEDRRGGRVPIRVEARPPALAVADTLDAFVAHVPEIVPNGVVAWTHVTSPFFGAARMDAAIRAYRAAAAAGTHDSLMSVRAIRSFVWSAKGCVSHDRTEALWPQTQDLEPLYEVDSALFVAPVETYRDGGDRIGERPLLHEQESLGGFDIDWPDDFALAERLYRAGVASEDQGEERARA